MAVSYVGHDTFGDANGGAVRYSGTGPVVYPNHVTGLAAGDLMFVLYADNGSTSPTAPTFPGGWTVLGGSTGFVPGSAGILKFWAAWKFATSGDLSSTVSITPGTPSTNAHIWAHLSAWRGVDTTTPINAIAADGGEQSIGTASTFSTSGTSGLTTSVANCMVAGWSYQLLNYVAAWTASAPLSTRAYQNARVFNAGDSPPAAAQELDYGIQASAGATPVITWGSFPGSTAFPTDIFGFLVVALAPVGAGAALSGSVAGVAALSGSIVPGADLSGSVAGASALSGYVGVASLLSGAVAGSSSLFGYLTTSSRGGKVPVIRNLALGPSGDIIVSGGQLQLVSDQPAIAQAIDCALSTFLGEWFLDRSVGVPYFQNILVKNPNLDVLRKTFTDAILTVRGVSAVKQLDMKYSPATRALTVAWAALGDTGQLVSGQTQF